MEKNYLTKSSFLFGNSDMYQQFGIQITDTGLPSDVLLPGLRSRKQTIPLRHGSYDYDAKYYNERGIQIGCVTTKILSREDTREIAYVLSKKSEIRFWNEPEKYYVGRVYETPTLEQLRNIGNRFTLIFICEPFAYGRTITRPFTGQIYEPDYIGTAPTPTYIEITNTGNTPITTIRITQINKKENY